MLSQAPRVSMFTTISIRKLIFYFILAGIKKDPFYIMLRYCELNRTDVRSHYSLSGPNDREPPFYVWKIPAYFKLQLFAW